MNNVHWVAIYLDKVRIVNRLLLNYGTNKIIVQNRNFKTKNDVNECMLTLKPKKCEGFDRIPVCIISDAADIL